MSDDPYLEKQLTLHQSGLRLRFDVAQDLFSSHDVDLGTRFLLRTILGAEHRDRTKVLDLGCGYGAIGLALKAENPKRTVHLVDRDALAVRYARANASLNDLDPVEASGSLGYDDVADTDFDLIVSNIPGKAGGPVIEHLLLDARHRLAPDGLVAVVIVLALSDAARTILAEDEELEVVLDRSTKRYTVFHYRWPSHPAPAPPSPAFDRGVYDRTDVVMRHRRHRWEATTAHGLPEFDSLGHHSELVIDRLADLGRGATECVVVQRPGQGHVPVVAWTELGPAQVRLASRDLLALRTSHANLVRNGCPPGEIAAHHQAGLGSTADDADVVVLMPDRKAPPAAVVADLAAAAAGVRPDGAVILAGASTLVTRCLDRLGPDLTPGPRSRRKGFSAVTLSPSGTAQAS